MYIDKRWVWRKRKRFEAYQAIWHLLRLFLQIERDRFMFWVGTALCGVEFCVNYPEPRTWRRATGLRFFILPRLGRKEGEDLYLIPVDLRLRHGKAEP